MNHSKKLESVFPRVSSVQVIGLVNLIANLGDGDDRKRYRLVNPRGIGLLRDCGP